MKILETLQQDCRQRNIPIISIQTQTFLESFLQQTKPKICFEIGSAVGYSTIFIASIISEWGGQVISFEIALNAYREALENIKDSQVTNITLYPFDAKTIDIRKFVPQEIDFAFVDGQKNQYGIYLEKLEGTMAKKSTIIIDDVIKYHGKLSLLYEYLQKKQIIYKILQLDEDDGIMIIQNN